MTSKRVVPLDVLRGVAILLVIFFHGVLDSHHVGKLRPLVGELQRFGWTGVDLFFVLSGFLVGGLLLKEVHDTSQVRSGRFLVRRAFKIWPAYYVLLLVVYLSGGANGQQLEMNLFHLQNYFGTPLIHTWSLAVEEHFYLALALLIALLARWRRGARALPACVLFVIVFCTSARWLVNHNKPYNDWQQRYPTHLCADSLMFGVLLAYGWHFKPAFREWVSRHRRWLLVGGVALLTPMMILPVDRPFVRIWGIIFLYIGYGAVVVSALQLRGEDGWLASIFQSRWLAFIGSYSYSIYLWHLFAGYGPAEKLSRAPWVERLVPELRWLIVTSVYVALAISFGVIIGWIIERPLLALRDRLFPSLTRPIA
jgi:peptidoglycan/LPS O-acetylase OafA/YrhL